MKKFFIVLGVSAIVIACGSGGDKKETKGTETLAAAGSQTTESIASTNEKGLELIGASDCTTCHALHEKKIGPSYEDVSKKYENTDANVEMLVSKIIKGGAGNWGEIPMTAHPDLKEEDATEMVKYILSMNKQ